MILTVLCVMLTGRDLLTGDGSAAAAAANADLECACESVVSSVIAMLPPRCCLPSLFKLVIFGSIY